MPIRVDSNTDYCAELLSFWTEVYQTAPRSWTVLFDVARCVDDQHIEGLLLQIRQMLIELLPRCPTVGFALIRVASNQFHC